ncbi:PAS domain-containing sensor histidine kinase [Mucilaginibacter robiniae]|uniref:histidine kinase n=1 Tax=Mucilaginibacter robiniae TaxID=2728022 RepID=A0A7L5E2F9_9SPHI|nr:PAS domain-containing sensor histidine kinase [Mucilaginibacter robiniae]QJD94536.1 PAS domain-containing sensor histidine kinase [Mucilaginibacter robiniae]
MLPETDNAGSSTGSFYQTDNQLKHLFMQMPGPVVLLRWREGVCELFNPVFHKLWSGRDLLNKPMREIWPELDGRGWFETVEHVYDTGETAYMHDFAVLSNWHNGLIKETFFDFVYSPYYNQQGHIDGVVITGLDVTTKVASRKQLVDHQQLLTDMTDAADAALWMVDAKGNITFVNQTWVDWTGQPKEAHFGRGWVEFVMPEDREHVIMRYIRDGNSKKKFEIDFRVLRNDGKTQWVAASGKPRYLANGNFAGYVGSCMDITERKNAEQLIKDSEERFRNIADSAPVLIWMTDTEKETTFLNKSWLQFTDTHHLPFDSGYLQSDLLHPQDVNGVAERYNKAFDTREEFYIEYRMKSNSGAYRWIGMKGVPHISPDGAFAGFIGSGMDITEMKEHEQIKNDFIGMASHELKTPITSIKAYVQLLLNIYKDANDDDFLKKSLNTVNKQISKLTRLISDLLDVSKMESGQLSLNTEPVKLNDLLKETVEEVQHTATHHDIVYQHEGVCTVLADRDRIAQVITNFLTNAIKYSPENDRVDVKLSIKYNEALVAVQDYGIGINPIDQNKIFNRFYRVEGRNEQTFSGFGIGLYVAAEIIKRHNGKFWVESEKGKGSVFYFSIPLITP